MLRFTKEILENHTTQFSHRMVLAAGDGDVKFKLLRRRGRSDELFLLFFVLGVVPFDEDGGGGMSGGDGPHIRRPLRLRNM